MRVLYLCHRIPYPPNKGDKIRAFHQICGIARHHEVDVFTLADDSADVAHREALESHCHNVTVASINPKLARLRALPFLLTRAPLTVPYFYSAELASEVRKALLKRSYDRIFIYCSAMAQYVESNGAIPTIMDLVDVDSDKWTQYAAFTKFPFSAVYRREGWTLRHYERRACEKVTCVLVSTDREAQLAREIAPAARIQALPNGVDTEHFRPTPQVASTPSVIFTGDMSYFPNEEAAIFFARQVLPLIQQSIPEARFLIVGRNPGRRVRELGQLGGVEVTGFVPDVRTWLHKGQVAVAPFTIAAGIQNKILEAMSCGLPVVATPRAAQGLSHRVAHAVDTGDSPKELASRVGVLLRDPERARMKGVNGRCLVMEDYSWEKALGKLLELVENPMTAEIPNVRVQSSPV
jgi:sugar transferase (PEP-CTERM/EpsH1 system associated)